MNNVLVSIIVPIYNVEKYIRQCMKGLLEQNFSNYEIILINDGTKDNSIEKIKDIIDEKNNILLINQENKGLSDARNTGLRYAKGKYIYFCDSDDFIDENLLDKCFKMCEKDNLDILYFDAKSFYSEDFKHDGNNYLEDYNRRKIILNKMIMLGREFFHMHYLHGGYRASVCLAFYKKSFLDLNELKFTKGMLHEDEEFTFKSMFLAERVSYISDCLYMRRIRGNSILTSQISEKHILSLLYVMKSNLNFIFQNNIPIDYVVKKYFNDYYGQIRKKIFDYKFNNSVIEKYIDEYFEYYNKIDNGKIETDLAIGLCTLQCNIKKQCSVTNDYSVMNYYEKKVAECFGIMDCSRLKDIFNKCEFSLLERLQLNKPDRIIGIYGIGRHTIGLLREFEKNIGPIKSNVIFIDSYKKSNTEEFENRKIINVADVNKYDFDQIILSSYSYQNEMLNKLTELIKSNVSIIELYNKENSTMFFGNDFLSIMQ